MKLFYSRTSPYVRKVMVLLAETGQLGDVELVPAAGSPVNTGTMPLDHNPLGKIPALQPEKGPAIFDSRVICRYLDARAGGKLYPSGDALWPVLTLEAMGDGMTDVAILMVYESRVRPEDKRMPEWVEGQWQKVSRALDALDTTWLAHLTGPLTMGQVAVGCALEYLDFRHAARNWREARPNLAAWQKGFGQTQSMLDTVPLE